MGVRATVGVLLVVPIALAVASGVAVSCATPLPARVTKPVAERSGVELGQAQIERVQAMGHPGLPPPDASNRYADDLRAARLGQLLFFDVGISGPGNVSCATCHDPARAFTDGLALAQGIARGVRNSPTLFDVAHQSWFNWDGRFDSLWSQSHGPITHPREMGGSFAGLVERIRAQPELLRRYNELFGELPEAPLNGAQLERVLANAGKAIAAYERKLVTGPSIFDRWVARWREAGSPRQLDLVPNDGLSPSALRGLDTFTSRGQCWKCHEGKLLTDGEFHALGAAPRGDLISDSGRFGAIAPLKASPFRASGSHSDDPRGERGKIVDSLIPVEDQWGAFRTPPLRNLSATAPYFHQGQFATLEEVIAFYSTLEGAVTMDHHQESVLVPRNFDAQEAADLAAFLRSLDGEAPPAEWLANPWDAIRP
jgi:cytochrome c peroxidase